MKILVADAQGDALNWLVAKTKCLHVHAVDDLKFYRTPDGNLCRIPDYQGESQAEAWKVIDQYRMEFIRIGTNRMGARLSDQQRYVQGKDHVEASLRAFVQWRLGAIVEIPEVESVELQNANPEESNG